MPKSKIKRKKHSASKRIRRAKQIEINNKRNQRFLDEVKSHPGYADMSPEQKALLHDTVAFKQMVESCDSIAERFVKSFESAKKKYNCRQVQYILQDLESIRSHIASLQEDGPIEADKEIPLEDSELGDDEGGNSTKTFSGLDAQVLPKEMIEDAMAVEEMEREDAQN